MLRSNLTVHNTLKCHLYMLLETAHDADALGNRVWKLLRPDQTYNIPLHLTNQVRVRVRVRVSPHNNPNPHPSPNPSPNPNPNPNQTRIVLRPWLAGLVQPELHAHSSEGFAEGPADRNGAHSFRT